MREDGKSAKLYLRNRIKESLSNKNVSSTPQAIEAILESLYRSNPEYVGDTDTLLLGLLYSGSYTVDVLEDAGADPYVLRTLSKDSATSESAFMDETDPINVFFGSDFSAAQNLLDEIQDSGRKLETADLLKAAVNPINPDPESQEFPIHQRRDTEPLSDLERELESRVVELLIFAVIEFHKKLKPAQYLAKRKTSLKPGERNEFRRYLKSTYSLITDNEVEFYFRILDEWYLHRHLLIEPADQCLRLIAAYLPCLFGTSHLAESGGSLSKIDTNLNLAQRFSPERDYPTIALMNHKGRIVIGQYTYRNRFQLDLESSSNHSISSVGIQAIRPVPLLDLKTMWSLEDLLNKGNLKERDLQSFLKNRPEILPSLGYSIAHPHLTLNSHDGTQLIPDFILELPDGMGFDIMDLKLPTANVVARQPYARASYELMKAVAQLKKYEKFFDDIKNSREFEQKYGLVPFKPELIIVMGRSEQFRSADERLEVLSQIGDVELITWDEVLKYGSTRSILVPESDYGR